MIAEVIMLEVQPKDMAGRISGLKGFIREMTCAFGILVVGLLWDIDYQWFWYAQASAFTIGLLLMLSVVVCETFVNHRKTKYESIV